VLEEEHRIGPRPVRDLGGDRTLKRERLAVIDDLELDEVRDTRT
jgi:hypothetical protein